MNSGASSCPQSSGGGRASGTRPGAAEEEVRETTERQVSDAVIYEPAATKCWAGYLWVNTNPRMGHWVLFHLLSD